jgi:multicomponent Na+:H+ antiporter subunit B
MSSESTNEAELSESLREVTNGPGSNDYKHRTTVVARTVARAVVPIILLVAISLLLQGHNLPGGGFIGGVLTATAFVVIYVIFGLDFLQDQLLDRSAFDAVSAYRWLFSLGLAIALLAGLTPILLGFPFLTQGVLFLEQSAFPLFHELEVASAFAFDLGVYFVVVGALLAVLAEVGAE